jgi:hypothetical protein
MQRRRPAFWEHQIKDSYNLLNGVREFLPLRDQVVWNIAEEVRMHVIPSAAARPVKSHCSGSSSLLRGISETSRFFFNLRPIWML